MKNIIIALFCFLPIFGISQTSKNIINKVKETELPYFDNIKTQNEEISDISINEACFKKLGLQNIREYKDFNTYQVIGKFSFKNTTVIILEGKNTNETLHWLVSYEEAEHIFTDFIPSAINNSDNTEIMSAKISKELIITEASYTEKTPHSVKVYYQVSEEGKFEQRSIIER
jgi:hypothetical protein